MYRSNTALQLDEIAFVRRSGVPFLTLYNPQTQSSVGKRDTKQLVFSQNGQHTVFIKNIGTDLARFQVMGAYKANPATTSEGDIGFTLLGTERTVAGGGVVTIELGPDQYNLIRLIPTGNSKARLRIQTNSFSPWTVWKTDDQQDRGLKKAIIVETSNGIRADAPIVLSGGSYAKLVDEEYVPASANDEDAVRVYQFVINGVPVGDWFESPSTLPSTIVDGDVIQVRDVSGKLSSPIMVPIKSTHPIDVWLDRIIEEGFQIAHSGFSESQVRATFKTWYADLQGIPGLWEKLKDMAWLCGLSSWNSCSVKVKDGTGNTPRLLLTGTAPTYNPSGSNLGSRGDNTSTVANPDYALNSNNFHSFIAKAPSPGGSNSGYLMSVEFDALFVGDDGWGIAKPQFVGHQFCTGTYQYPVVSYNERYRFGLNSSFPVITETGAVGPIPSGSKPKLFGNLRIQENPSLFSYNGSALFYSCGDSLTEEELGVLTEACDRVIRTFDNSRPRNILFFGDSITKGQNSSELTNRYTKLISDGIGLNELNCGVPSMALRSRFGNLQSLHSLKDWASHQTNVEKICVMIGTNDVSSDNISGENGQEFEEKLEEFVLSLVSVVGADNVIIGTIPWRKTGTITSKLSLVEDYNARIVSIASSVGVCLAHVYQHMELNGADSLMDDDVHPNTAGHAVIAGAFLNAITRPFRPSIAPVLTITGVDPQAGVVNLEWTESDKADSDGFGYLAQVRHNGGSWSAIGTLSSLEMSYNLTSGHGIYEFRITPKNDIGSGPVSNTESINNVTITAPNGVYAGVEVTIDSGITGESEPYQFVINDVGVGDWFDSPGTVPETVVAGDKVQVRDINENLSNYFIAVSVPDPTEGLFSAFRFEGHDGRTLMPPRDYIDVSGAGTEEVNGRYYLSGVNFYVHTSSLYAIGHYLGYGDQWRIGSVGGDVNYYSTGAVPNPDPASVETVTWNAEEGIAPMPTAVFGVEIRSHRDCIVVSGAGVDAANGRYYQPNPNAFYWSKPGGFALGWNLGFGDFWYLVLGGDILYQTPPDSTGDPSSISWTATDPGYGNAPTVSRIQEPQYAPLGLYRDVSFTDPAAIDEQVGGWEFPSKPARVTESNVMLQPVLRSHHGIPALEFGGDYLANRTNSTPLHTAITVLAKNVSGNYSQAVVVGDGSQAIRFGITGQLIDGRYKGNSSTVTADINWPDVYSIVSLVLNGANWELWLEGNLIASHPGPPIAGFSGNLYLGGDPDTLIGGTDGWAGDIIAAYGYDAADRLAFEARCEQLKGGVL